MVHNEAVLLSINAKYWEVKPGKYSYSGDPDKTYQVSYNPLAFGYCAIQDTEILHNSRLSTEVKVGLVKHLANIFHSMLLWKQDTRGRKLGIEADLTRGGIAHNQDSKLSLEIEYYKRYDEDKYNLVLGGRLESFIIRFRGCIDGKMPYEHRVYIDASGNARLGCCSSIVQSNRCNDMSDIFKAVY